jgi:hypothetical protein
MDPAEVPNFGQNGRAFAVNAFFVIGGMLNTSHVESTQPPSQAAPSKRTRRIGFAFVEAKAAASDGAMTSLPVQLSLL